MPRGLEVIGAQIVAQLQKLALKTAAFLQIEGRPPKKSGAKLKKWRKLRPHLAFGARLRAYASTNTATRQSEEYCAASWRA